MSVAAVRSKRGQRPVGDMPVEQVADAPEQKSLQLGGAWDSLNWDSMRAAVRDRFGISLAEDDDLKVMVFMFSVAMQAHWAAVADSATGDIASVLGKFRKEAEEISSEKKTALREQLIELAGRISGMMTVNTAEIAKPLKEQATRLAGEAEKIGEGRSATRLYYVAVGVIAALALFLVGAFAGILFGRHWS